MLPHVVLAAAAVQFSLIYLHSANYFIKTLENFSPLPATRQCKAVAGTLPLQLCLVFILGGGGFADYDKSNHTLNPTWKLGFKGSKSAALILKWHHIWCLHSICKWQSSAESWLTFAAHPIIWPVLGPWPACQLPRAAWRLPRSAQSQSARQTCVSKSPEVSLGCCGICMCGGQLWILVAKWKNIFLPAAHSTRWPDANAKEPFTMNLSGA